MRKNDFDAVDRSLSKTMRKYSKPALQVSLAIIFIWFGALKPLGLSPAEGLLKKTVAWLPLLGPDAWLHIIGYWENLDWAFVLVQTYVSHSHCPTILADDRHLYAFGFPSRNYFSGRQPIIVDLGRTIHY